MVVPTIPYIELNSNPQAPLLHFAHANGYPPETYEPLLRRLAARFHVTAMVMKPLWEGSNPREVQDWGDFVGDMITFIEQHTSPGGVGKEPVIGVGHSLGATVSLMAAIQRPDLFRAIILLDPPFFPPWVSFIWNVAFRLGLVYWLHPLIKGTVKRRNFFEHRETMYSHYRRINVFQKIGNEGLWTYVNAMAKPVANGGVELRYSPAWEARVYATGILRDWKTWRNLRGFSLPILLLRPEHMPTTPNQTKKLLQQIAPQTIARTIPDTTHLAPLEKPDVVAEMIFDFLD